MQPFRIFVNSTVLQWSNWPTRTVTLLLVEIL